MQSHALENVLDKTELERGDTADMKPVSQCKRQGATASQLSNNNRELCSLGISGQLKVSIVTFSRTATAKYCARYFDSPQPV